MFTVLLFVFVFILQNQHRTLLFFPPFYLVRKKMDVATMLYSFFLLLTNVNFMQTF